MSAAAISTGVDGISTGTRRRLAGFARTLRENGFKVGLAETRDALAVLLSPAAVRRRTSPATSSSSRSSR